MGTSSISSKSKHDWLTVPASGSVAAFFNASSDMRAKVLRGATAPHGNEWCRKEGLVGPGRATSPWGGKSREEHYGWIVLKGAC